MRVHFLGIGGAGLSALAGWMNDKGYQVSGCDVAVNERTKPLIEKGVKFFEGNSREHVKKGVDWLIFPNINQSHPEIVEAKKQGIKTSTYFEALGEAVSDYFTIAVCGAHGKTTTTLMIKTILEQIGRDPNAIIGEGIYRSGTSDIFVVEACEYKKQFLSLKPDLLVITNIAYDHPDCYQSKEDTLKAFIRLVSQMKKGSLVIGYVKDPYVKKVLAKAREQGKKTQEYGEEIEKFQPKKWGSESVVKFGSSEFKLELKVPGKHNVFNALAAIRATAGVKVAPGQAVKALASFTGCSRRLERMGKIGRAVVINDYGHHPDQIKAVISALRSVFSKERLIAVFEPHQYERTWRLFDQLVTCWQGVDKLILLPIYYVKGRESKEAVEGVNIKEVKKGIVAHGVKVKLLENYQELWDEFKKEGQTACVIIVLSAGPIDTFLKGQKFSSS